jgi:hypothetical protein
VIMMAPPTTTAAAPKPSPSHSWKWKAGIGLGVAAVAVLGYGISQRLSANGTFSDFNNRVPSGQGTGKCDADDRVLNHGGEGCDALLDKGNSAATRATVTLIAGGLLAAGSAALLAVTWNEPLVTHEAAAAPRAQRLSSLRCNPVLLQPGLTCALTF